ncbi:hypothetical protein V2J09_012008 [Rumex salicifolius]
MSNSSGDTSSTAAGEIMLFGVRVVVDSMRKSVSLNNLSQYAHPQDLLVAASADKDVAIGYASADESAAGVHNRSPSSASGNRERKRGVPWTEEEHKLFLLGLQKVGKGDWRGISRNFVKSRTPTQVASHAQKYYLRRCNINRRRRRSSLFDITTEAVSGNPMAEQNAIKANVTSQSPQHTSVQGTSSELSNISFSTTPMASPAEITHYLPEKNPNNFNNNLIQSTPVLLVGSTTMANFDLNDNSMVESSSLSLNLSLAVSSGQSNRSRQLDFQAIRGFSDGDNIISVA